MSAQRVVLDTNVWLDLLWFEDARCAALRAAFEAGRVRAAMRADCRAELVAVLDYPALAIAPARRAALLAAADAYCEVVASSAVRVALPRCRDADDQKFVELAHEAAASALLTRDDALLALDRRMRRRGLCPVLRPERWAPDSEDGIASRGSGALPDPESSPG